MPKAGDHRSRSRARADLCGHSRITFLDDLLHSLSDFNNAVDSEVLKSLDNARRRPPDNQLVYLVVEVEPKMLAESTLRSVAVSKHDLPRLLQRSRINRNTRSDCIPVRFCAYQFHLQPITL